MLRHLAYGAGLCLTLLNAACATLVQGTTQEVTFDSEPQGANIRIAGISRGLTPTTLTLKRNGPADVTIDKEGYTPQVVNMHKGFEWWSAGNLVFGGLAGSTTDTVSGAITRFKPDGYYVKLSPDQPVRHAQYVQPVQQAQPVQQVRQVQTARPVQQAQPAQAVQQVRYAQPAPPVQQAAIPRPAPAATDPRRIEVKDYLLINHDQLMEELATGGGDAFNALLLLVGINDQRSQHEALRRMRSLQIIHRDNVVAFTDAVLEYFHL